MCRPTPIYVDMADEPVMVEELVVIEGVVMAEKLAIVEDTIRENGTLK